MLEVEVKAKIIPEKIKEKLLQMGANFAKKEKQVDIYFRHPSRNFASRDEALRVREIDGRFFLTYKGPRVEKETKTREEIEVTVKGDILPLLKKLGFEPLESMEKEREIYNWNDLKVCIDGIKELGSFLEVEGERKQDKQKIFGLLSELGLSADSLIKESYLEMFMKKR